jgi:putative protease
MPHVTTTPTPQKGKPLLLAPAGDRECLRAAVANGADAVYFGLPSFNARRRAANFTMEELPDVMAFLHARNVQGYVALNTLIFSDELSQAADCVAAAATAGADAVIVQDVGLASLVRAMAPTLAIHASTQMTLTEPRAIARAAELGASRVILPRELSAAQVASLAAATSVELEVFVHGALCVSYSGQCLASEALMGRSANRGQCAQVCRLPYELMLDDRAVAGGHLLSPRDLAGVEMVAELSRAGVAAMKIEGRLKGPHYVAAATWAYRQAIDAAAAGQKFVLSQRGWRELEQSFSRGFTRGFLGGQGRGGDFIASGSPSARGARIGTVVALAGRAVALELDDGADVAEGDGLAFGSAGEGGIGGRVYLVHRRGGRRVEVVFAREVDISGVSAGDAVLKTDDPRLRQRLEQTWSRDVVVHRTPVAFRVEAAVGQPLRLTASDDRGHRGSAQSDAPLQAALKHPLTLALLREQLSRLGDTPLELAGVDLVDAETGLAVESIAAMAPKSVLNELRRRAVDELLSQRAVRHAVDGGALGRLLGQATEPSEPVAPPQEPVLTVLARTAEQARAAAASGAAAIIFLDLPDADALGALVAELSPRATVGVATPRILAPGGEDLLERLAAAAPAAVLARNIGAMDFFAHRLPGASLVADFSLNVANELAAARVLAWGARRFTPADDLSFPQMSAMLRAPLAGRAEMLLHHHVAMFHTEHCVIPADSGHKACRGGIWRLRDRLGVEHPLTTDACCRTTVFNAVPQSAAQFAAAAMSLGVRHFRVELLREDAAGTSRLIDIYARLLRGELDGDAAWQLVKDLSPLGATRGTLAPPAGDEG